MKSNNQVSNPETDKPQEIPKEIWMMVDHLFRNAKKQVRIALFSRIVFEACLNFSLSLT